MKYFEALGLRPGVKKSDVKKAWRKIVKSAHPDHGGDSDKFIELRKAYELALENAVDDDICELCNGTGKVERAVGWSSLTVGCTLCKGTGKSG